MGFFFTYLPLDGSGKPSKVHETVTVGFPAALKKKKKKRIVCYRKKQIYPIFFRQFYQLSISVKRPDLAAASVL